MIENLVFSGAGVKIYTLIGFIKCLDEKDLLKNIKSVIGTSSGSLIATLIVLNLKYSEIEEIFLKLDMTNFKNINTENIMKFFENYGVDDGSELKRVIQIIFSLKINNSNPTFKELYEITNKKLVICATCVNTMEIEYFCHETNPDFYVVDALMMSTCVPLLFKPIVINDKYYIDGGMTKHYPIDYFKNEQDKTLGILVYSNLTTEIKIEGLKDYITNILFCGYANLVKNCYNDFKKNTILIENEHNFLDFDIEYNTKLSLLEQGYNETKKRVESEEFKIQFHIC